MKICIASLRQRIHWTHPVSCIQDAFFRALRRFISRSNHQATFHNVSWSEAKPCRNYEALADADLVIVMTSGEWTWSTGAVPQTWIVSYDKNNEPALMAMQNRNVLVLTMDRADDLAFLRKSLFKTTKFASEQIISECDFPQTIQSLRYEPFSDLTDHTQEKKLDFSYWGSPKRLWPGKKKSGDARYDILRDVMTRDLHSVLIGNTFGKRKQEKGFDSDMKNVIPHVSKARLTCCFQWPGHGQYLTARYHEALAMDIIPLVHSGYDVRNDITATPWQRIRSANDIVKKIIECRDPNFFGSKLEEISEHYMKNRPTDATQMGNFACELNKTLERVSQ